MEVKHWFMGLVAALVSGAANGVVLMVADPLHFNLQDAHALLVAAGVSGVLAAAAYLKQSPVPAGE